MDYAVITERYIYEGMYGKVREEGLMESLNPSADPTLDEWLWFCESPTSLVLGGYIEGTMAGFLVGENFGRFPSQTMEIGVCSFRDYVGQARELSMGAYLWCFEHLDCKSLIGRTPVYSRHVLRMAPEVGFRAMGPIGGLIWSERKGNFVDGYLLTATEASVREAMKRRR